jgi:hypothetical protein
MHHQPPRKVAAKQLRTRNLRGRVLTSLWAARFSACVLVELCVFREGEECAVGLFPELLLPLVAASVDEALEELEGCL